MSDPAQTNPGRDETLIAHYGQSEGMDPAFRRSIQAHTQCRIARHRGAWRRVAGRLSVTVAAVAVAVGLANRVPSPLPTVPSPGPSEVAAVLRVSPPAYAGLASLRPGARVTATGELRTGPGGALALVGPLGSEITLGGDTRVRLGGTGVIHLAVGSLHLRNRGHEFGAIQTSAGRITLLGTEVNVTANQAGQATVAVLQGRVEIHDRFGRGVVGPGAQVSLPRSATGISRPVAPGHPGSMGGAAGDLVVYPVMRDDGPVQEVWTVNVVTGERRRLRVYVGWLSPLMPLVPESGEVDLVIRSALWIAPDDRTGVAYGNSGQPIVPDSEVVVDLATGEERPVPRIDGLKPLYQVVSPDGRWLAFCGRQESAPGSKGDGHGGVWVMDLASRRVRCLLSGSIMSPVSWSPDSRTLVLSSANSYTNNHHLMLADVRTGRLSSLGINGAGAVFSPDGSRIAYCAGFRKDGSWWRGVPTSGRLFVLDLNPRAAPIEVSGEFDEVSDPHWSPDGTRLLYSTSSEPNRRLPRWLPGRIADMLGLVPQRTWAAYVADAAGAGSRWVCQGEGFLVASRWRPDGRSIIAVDTERAVVVDAANGRLVRSMALERGSADPMEEAQVMAATAGIKRAIYQYAVASSQDEAEGRQGFRDAARSLVGLPFRYPLARLSVGNLGMYADEAGRRANE